MQLKATLAFGVLPLLLLLSASCGRQHLKVAYLPAPHYPIEALSRQIQGSVVVTLGIGTDGKVIYATGKGSSSLLVQAADENAKSWIFEVPPHARFPLEHRVTYTFTFDKNGGFNIIPTVVTDLPNAIQIIGTPAGGDNFTLIQPKASNKSAGPAASRIH